MNASGQITAIRFYNNFFSNLPNKPTQIWLGETPLADLSNGWIPASQLTQVFSGSVDYPAGMNEITVTFATPFAYGGGNLVMMVFRPWDDRILYVRGFIFRPDRWLQPLFEHLQPQYPHRSG